DWYSTLQKSNVKLITNRIKQIKSHSIITYDGDEYPVDIIIWSTGFQTQKFALPIYGINGCSLAEQWSETVQAYRGITVPNFPNLFILLGPNSRLGHSSVIIMLEAQLEYMVETLLYIDKNNLQSFSIKQNVHDEYNQWIQSKLHKTVWYLGGCHSWYQNVKGTVTTIWPDFTWIYYLLMKKLDLLLLILGFLIVLGTSLVLGLIGHFFYWLLYDSFGRYEKRAKRKLKCINNQRDDEYYVIIIGTGFSGLGMAIKMNDLGMDNYILIERYGHVGGTWYANKYPGCACDVPSNLYSFSFEPNPKWSHYFSRQPEIAEYLEYCTDKYNIRRHIHFNTNVTKLKWIEEQKLWQVTTQSNSQEKIFYARSIVLGSGPLSNASYPTDIPGIDKFEGQMCHTAEWDQSIDVKNKRVAVIGTGASAIQTVPEIQQMNVSQLLVFQRTPPWVIPRLDRSITDWEKNLLKRFPIIQKLIRVIIYWIIESVALSFAYRWSLKFINDKLVKYNLERQVKDIELRKKVTPTWEFGCKRMLITNDWYSTLQKSNVKLITNRIKQIKSHSIITYDGDEYPVDIIIWS
ncbi:unnamed protein product, partial [Rotaria sordida]